MDRREGEREDRGERERVSYSQPTIVYEYVYI
jgi:hypothetical protein